MIKMFSENKINKIAKSSGSATSGKVLTADGNGGSSWQSAGGGGTQLYRHSLYKTSGPGAYYRLIFITTTATPITYNETVGAWQVEGEIVSTKYIDEENDPSMTEQSMCYVGSGSNGNVKYIKYLIKLNYSSSTVSWINITYKTAMTDTVTEIA